MYYGFTLEGDDFVMEFAWWDWSSSRLKSPSARFSNER
jgi:hypothetical protein